MANGEDKNHDRTNRTPKLEPEHLSNEPGKEESPEVRHVDGSLHSGEPDEFSDDALLNEPSELHGNGLL